MSEESNIWPDSGTDANDELIAWLELHHQDEIYDALEEDTIHEEDELIFLDYEDDYYCDESDLLGCSYALCEQYETCQDCPLNNIKY